MPRKILVPIVVLAALIAAGVWYLRRDGGAIHYTGYVEGEERVLRSEVTGRVLEVPFAEGESVAAEAVVAILDDRDIAARIHSKEEELRVIESDVHTQEEKVGLVEATWQRDVGASTAAVHEAESAAELARRTYERERDLAKTGASTAQLLDDARARKQQAHSNLQQAREMLARAQAQEGQITLARRQLDGLKQRLELARAQLAELQVTRAKYTIHAPATATIVQTQFIWPGELAQPGSAIIAVLDPRDKYVQIYVPVADVGLLHLGQRVAIELDSLPGQRIPGEVSFIADQANFTPEKIETRSDRMGQVYRVKVRILEGVERFQPGTEGNVYLDEGGEAA